MLEHLRALPIFDKYYRNKRPASITTVSDLALSYRALVANTRLKLSSQKDQYQRDLAKGNIAVNTDLYKKISSGNRHNLQSVYQSFLGQRNHYLRQAELLSAEKYKPGQILDENTGMTTRSMNDYNESAKAYDCFAGIIALALNIDHEKLLS